MFCYLSSLEWLLSAGRWDCKSWKHVMCAWLPSATSDDFLVTPYSIESICVSILIGISCDFVIHFTHAYSSLKGDVDRHTRTRTALIVMGPSILAAAFTTLTAASIMLFTTITFFVKFAVVLFFTIVQATVASFVVFIVIADVCGPSRPTYLIDKMVGMIKGKNTVDEKRRSSFDSQLGREDHLGTTEPPPSSEGSSKWFLYKNL